MKKKRYHLNLNIDDILGEVWQKCIFTLNGKYYDLSGKYWVSNYGRVKSFFKGRFKIVKNVITKTGYCSVGLNYKPNIKVSILVHRLVLYGFKIKNIENKVAINHKNCIKTDNTLMNLEWCTYLENSIHAKENDLRKYKSRILTKYQIIEISKKLIPVKAVLKKYKISDNVVYSIRSGRSWSNITNIVYHAKDCHGNSKLTQKQVLYITSSNKPLLELSKKFNTSKSVICNIKNGNTWNWLTKIK